MSSERRLMLTIAFCGILFHVFVGVAQAECVCNTTCSDCVSCPRRYQTIGPCAACYKSTPAKDSVLCTFAGTMAPAPVPAAPPSTDGPRFPPTITPETRPLPGTRPDILLPMRWRPDRLNPGRAPELPDTRADAFPAWPDIKQPSGNVGRSAPGSQYGLTLDG